MKEPNSRLASQEIILIFIGFEYSAPVHKSLQPVYIRSRINPIHTLTPFLF
jgi:hypothetical protein